MICSFIFLLSLSGSVELTPIMADVFHELYEKKEIQTAFSPNTRIRFIKGISWNNSSEIEKLENFHRDLLYLVSMKSNIEIIGINKLNEECLWPLIRKHILSETQQDLGERIVVVRLDEADTLAFVNSNYEMGRVGEVPLQDDNWLYIKNIGLLQRQFFKKVFGSEDVIFLRRDVNQQSGCESAHALQTFAEEIRHWIDFNIDIPFVGSKIFHDLRYREKSVLRPPLDTQEIELMDYQYSDLYRNAYENQMTSRRAELEDLVSAADLRLLISIWDRQIRSSLDYQFSSQWNLLYSYLLDPIEIRGKWEAAKILKVRNYDGTSGVESLFLQHFPSHWMQQPRVQNYWKELWAMNEMPKSRSISVLRQVSAMKWSEDFEEIVAMMIFQSKVKDEEEIQKMLIKLNEIASTRLSLQEILLRIYQVVFASEI